MKYSSFFLFAIGFVCLQLASVCAAEGAKLKIGIKKRVENCETKTKKGDLVHIHYTVSFQQFILYKMLTQFLIKYAHFSTGNARGRYRIR